MATGNGSGGGIGLAGVVIGALIVLGLGYFLLSGSQSVSPPSDVNVKVEAPKATPDAPKPADTPKPVETPKTP